MKKHNLTIKSDTSSLQTALVVSNRSTVEATRQGYTGQAVPTFKPWLVKAPGTHGKGWRVVESIGFPVAGPEIFAAICEMCHSRSSADNYSDATERKRAEQITSDHNDANRLLAERDALRDALQAIIACPGIEYIAPVFLKQSRAALALCKEVA